DLQTLVHDDVAADLRAYRAKTADAHIDHRRISTLYTFFRRRFVSLSTTDLRDEATWRPGDVVFITHEWRRGAPPEHVAIVRDVKGRRGIPLLVENGGPRPVEHDSLGRKKIVAHFRVVAATARAVRSPP